MRAAAGTRRGSLTLLLCLLSFSLPAFSQHTKSKNNPCDKPATTAQQAACTQKQWQAADAALGNYFSLVTIELDGSEVSALKKAQDAWVRYRKLNCAAEKATYEDGTAGSYNYNSCMTTMAEQRLKEMQAMYGWQVSK
ncbi:MAG TPA: lysozyme inhibitor LprI family protein [Acidobacteriaceae bacterium]|nr:lysozyme inhibitor LprI family protein [Acidobacteriaceae bacterium]